MGDRRRRRPAAAEAGAAKAAAATAAGARAEAGAAAGWVVNSTLCGPYPLRGVPTTHTLLLLADKLTASSDSKTSK